MKKHLIFDATNLLYRTFFTHVEREPESINALCYHSTLISMFSIWKKERPNQTLLAFDRNNWRFQYTKSDECYSKRQYKGTRKDKRSPKVDQLHAQFKDFIVEIEQTFRDFTQIRCLAADSLEADDLIGGFVQHAVEQGDEVVIVSADKDFVQLLKYPNVRLFDPKSNSFRQVEDPEFYLFEKCFRGDHTTDNIQSAYPKLRIDKIRAAYTDEYLFTNLMNVTWTHPDGREMSVGKLFRENVLLTDLTAQPSHIRELIKQTISEELERKPKYNHFRMLKFLGKHDLKRLSEQIDTYLPMIAQRI